MVGEGFGRHYARGGSGNIVGIRDDIFNSDRNTSFCICCIIASGKPLVIDCVVNVRARKNTGRNPD